MWQRLGLFGELGVVRCVGLVVVVAGLVGNQPGRTADDRPNVLVFIADDMAVDDCGAYGHPKIRTSNIDGLARDGMKFANAFLTTSSCSPSRCSILTGRYPHSTGARQLHLPLPEAQVTIGQRLKEAGYHTAAAGKWHLGNPTRSEFDVVETRQYRWVETLKRRPRDKPFFMWFAFVDPHRPYKPGAIKKPHTESDAIVPPYLPDVTETRRDLALYYDEIARMDGVVGRVLAELKAQGADKNTMVVFLSDNGRPFPRCKTTLYDSGIKTPLLIRFPGIVKPGTVCSSLVSSVDLAPTIMDVCGERVPKSMQGRSFQALLTSPAKSIRRYIYAEHNWHDFDDHGRSVHSVQFNYIRNYYTDIPGTPPADAVQSPTFQVMRRLRDAGELKPHQKGCFLKPRPKEELYDVENDPHELRNLAELPKYAGVLKQMRGALAAWEQETADRVPESRRPDEFDRETGQRLRKQRGKKANTKQKPSGKTR